MKVLDLIRKEKKFCMLKLLRSEIRMNVLSVELCKRKKKCVLVYRESTFI